MRYFKDDTRWNNYFNDFLIKSKRTFELREKNSSITAVWNKSKNFGGTKRRKISAEEWKLMWIYSNVSQSFSRYIKKNPKFEVYAPIQSTVKDQVNIGKLKPGDIFLATDINHSYWRTAYLLGYVSEKLYTKLLDKEYKIYRNKAMACTISSTKVSKYKRGVLTEQRTEYNLPMRALYNNVRYYSYQSMQNAMLASDKGFLKYKTDCVYYLPKYKNKVENSLKDRDVGFKTNECTYIGEGMFIEKGEVKKL